MIDKEEKNVKPKREKYAVKTFLDLFIYLVKTAINLCISAIAFSAIVFLISVAFPVNVQTALEIFFNLFDKLR